MGTRKTLQRIIFCIGIYQVLAQDKVETVKTIEDDNKVQSTICADTENEKALCKSWKKSNLCSSDRGTMEKHCSLTCGFCSAGSISSPEQTTQTPTNLTAGNIVQTKTIMYTRELKHMKGLLDLGSKQSLTQTFQHLANITDMFLQEEPDVWQSDTTSSAMTIIQTVDEIGVDLAKRMVNGSKNFVAVLDHITFQVNTPTDNYYFPNYTNKGYQKGLWKDTEDFIFIPKSLFKKPQEKYQVFSALYHNLNELLPQSPVKVESSKDDLSTRNSYHIASRVISSSTIPDLSKTAKISVTFRLKHTKNVLGGKPVCVFWDFFERKGSSSGQWSMQGCHVVQEMSNENTTTCKCDHLTNFAILMQVNNVELSPTHMDILRLITLGGCGISILGVFLTVLAIAYLPGIRSERNLIHMNLAVAIGLSQAIFLASDVALDYDMVCKVTSITLHYFFLASFSWMMVEGIYLYTILIKVFNKTRNRFRCFFFVAWGLPLVIVVITAVLRFNGYGTKKSCWLSREHFVILAFIAPALLVVLVNTFIFVCVIVEIVKVHESMQRSKHKQRLKVGLRSTLILVPLLGLTWVFGILATNEYTVVFQYLFVICNSLQGFFIFLFHCLLNSEVRRAFRRQIGMIKEQHNPKAVPPPHKDKKTTTNTTITCNERLGTPPGTGIRPQPSPEKIIEGFNMIIKKSHISETTDKRY